jgi:alkanesulfonate monooxygenase SsuD/methylene tetrahydromethanopterin reductase-like flavin-dependent oxidoreductase (luciferase family)
VAGMTATDLKAGIYLPSNIEETGRPGRIAAHARHAEDVGLESVWMADHLIAKGGPRLDATLLAAGVAATTSRVRIGFGVLILPLRPVAWVAKQVVTLQYLSGGRLLLGIGSGGAVHGDAAWRAVGLPYRLRGRQTDEALAVLPDLVAGKPTALGGESVTLEPGAAMPPLLIAGSEATLDRVARYADEWYPAFTSTSYLTSTSRRLAEMAASYRRPAPGVTVNVSLGLGDVPASVVDDYVRAAGSYYGGDESAIRDSVIVGPPAEAATKLAALADAGVDRIVGYPFTGPWPDQAALLAEATRLATG